MKKSIKIKIKIWSQERNTKLKILIKSEIMHLYIIM